MTHEFASSPKSVFEPYDPSNPSHASAASLIEPLISGMDPEEAAKGRAAIGIIIDGHGVPLPHLFISTHVLPFQGRKYREQGERFANDPYGLMQADIDLRSGQYAENNGSAIAKVGDTLFIACTHARRADSVSALEAAGFARHNTEVPFSNGNGASYRAALLNAAIPGLGSIMGPSVPNADRLAFGEPQYNQMAPALVLQ